MLIASAIFLVPEPVSGQEEKEEEKPYPPKYRVYETEDLRIFYWYKEQEYVIEHVARCFENAFHYHQKFFG